MIVFVMEVNSKYTEQRIVKTLAREITMEMLELISAKNVPKNALYAMVLRGPSVHLVTPDGS